MLNKIQQYLILNHPLLWNLKLVPILIVTIILNIIFFTFGFTLTEIDFQHYLTNSSGTSLLSYFGIIITALLTFILWITSYSKNNAIKAFYPKTPESLYLEWVLSFVIILGIALFPYSYYMGSNTKIKTYASKEEVVEAIKVLNMADILLPETKGLYFLEHPEGYNHVAKKQTEYVPLDSLIEQVSHDFQNYEDYPNFTPLSLLNYSGYNRVYIPSDFATDVPDYRIVINWLEDREQSKISNLMDDVLTLIKKHNLQTNITTEEWMELIYNPDKYPVSDFNLISRDGINDYQIVGEVPSYKSVHRTPSSSPYSYYLQYNILVNNYMVLVNTYVNTDVESSSILIYICVALVISLLVFSYRVSSGKHWLIAVLSISIFLILILFLSLLISTSVYGSLPFLIYIAILFVCQLTIIINKIINNKSKGKSKVVINQLIWFIPTVPVLIYAFVYVLAKDLCEYQYNDCMYQYMDEHIIMFMWANVCLTFVTMWFFIRFILLKWKSLPEE